jgi:hypothetical protein
LWPQFKTVNLLCSVDAYGLLNDYIRYPSKWATVSRNLDMIDREHDRLNLGSASLSTTVQIYNLFKLAELIEYSHERFSFIRPMPNLVHLSIPGYFNIQYLPDDLKDLAARQLNALRKRLESQGITDGFGQLEGILAYMRSSDHSAYMMSEFRRVTAAFDQLRTEAVVELVPELAELMQSDSRRGLNNRFRLVKSQYEWLAGSIRSRFLR